MSQPDDLLQERLEQLENGAALTACLSGLPPEEAALLQLAAELRSIEAPAAANVAAQRAAVLAGSHPISESKAEKAGILALLASFFASPPRLAGALAFGAVIIIALVLWGNRPSPDGKLAQDINKETAVPTLPANQDTTAEERGEIAVVPEAAPNPPNTTFLPILSTALSTAPNLASLTDIQGFVEIQEADGSWQTVSGMGALAAGTQIRTGALSSAKLTFYDNSVAQIGPESGLTIAQLDAQRPEDGFRTVVLNQWQGESSHAVQFRGDGGSRYEVVTPDGAGVARGTKFQVTVSPEQFSRIAVTEGLVDVSGSGQTVSVSAGKLTTVPANEPPAAPAFAITGQGELSAMGDTWIIAGQAFVVNENTIITGAPQIGDIVFVSGYLAADGQNVANRIELLRRSPVNQFILTGVVTEMNANAWTIAGQTIAITPDTQIGGNIALNDKVRVSGVIEPDGDLVAAQIDRLPAEEGYPFAFTGVVQQMGDQTWQISGVVITVDGETAVSPNIQPGDIVSVQGVVLADQTWLAASITLVEPGTAAFTLSGLVQNMAPWQVAGIVFAVSDQTLIDDGTAVGDLVRVSGRILPDGSWLADRIELLDEDYLLEIIFVGMVDAIDPWVVNGLPLATNSDTRLDDDIAVGDLVRVTARILADGSWLALRIDRLSDDLEENCVAVTAVVTQIGGGILTLSNGSTIALDGVVVEGELKVGSVVMILACVAEDGSIQIRQIIVLYTPRDEPPPPAPQPTRPADNNGGDVTVCHKPGTPAQQTMTIPQPALSGHLGHGDTLGPCP